ERRRLVERELRVLARQRIGLDQLLLVRPDDQPLAEGEVDDRDVRALDEDELLALDLLSPAQPVDRGALDGPLDGDAGGRRFLSRQQDRGERQRSHSYLTAATGSIRAARRAG